METRRLKRDIEALLGQYIGQKLRENGFDPKGKGSSLLDDLAHYDLAISLALCWLDEIDGDSSAQNKLIYLAVNCLCRGATSPRHSLCPNRPEREAMILSSFARMLLNSLPVDEILSLYTCKPSSTCTHPDTKSNIVHPFSLSYHPFAMLRSFKAVDHSRKHTQTLKRWNMLRNKVACAGLKKLKPPSITPSSQSFFSESEDSLKEETKHYEDSQESEQNEAASI